MKLLLDEQVPQQLANCFPDTCEVLTVRDMGSDGQTNGRLLALAADEGFTALITADKNIQYQQNLDNLPLMLVVLVAYGNRIQELEPLVPGILEVLANNAEHGIYRVQS